MSIQRLYLVGSQSRSKNEHFYESEERKIFISIGWHKMRFQQTLSSDKKSHNYIKISFDSDLVRHATVLFRFISIASVIIAKYVNV